jgi:GAF domain-containing protein
VEEKLNFEALLDEVKTIVTGDGRRDAKLQAVCHLLKNSISYYNWVGVYLVDDEKRTGQAGTLVLGPFVGAPTEHVRIAFGQGICGQAAELEQTFVVQDVSQETNYLSCSPDVQSEIVVPIFKRGGKRDGEVVGELDIDSHTLAPFSEEDRAFLGEVCTLLARVF